MIGYIYGLKSSDSEEYRYIGKTSTSVRSRYTQHLRTAKYGSTLPVYNWIRKVIDSGNLVIVDTLAESSLENLDDLEIFYISKYRKNSDTLLNLTDGGSGTYNHKHSEEQKKKWSKERKGSITGSKNPNYGKFGPDHPSYGRKLSESAKKEISNRMSGPGNPNYGKHLSEETRKKMSIVRKGKPMPSSARSAHTRWHTNMNKVNPECTWCKENNA